MKLYSLLSAATSVLALLSAPINGDVLAAGVFSGRTSTASTQNTDPVSITVDREGGIKAYNHDFKCGNSEPVVPTSFKNGELKYSIEFDIGSFFDKRYLVQCMPADVTLTHESEEKWTYKRVTTDGSSSGTLTFLCAEECDVGSVCQSVYSPEDNGAGFGRCEALGSFDEWNAHVNEGALCPLPTLTPATEDDERTAVVEIDRQLDSEVCGASDTILDSLPDLVLRGGEVLVTEAPNESDTTVMAIQRQDDAVVISYTVRFFVVRQI